MDLITFGWCLYLFGLSAAFYNMLTLKDFNNVKYHLYSSLPAILGLILLFFSLFLK